MTDRDKQLAKLRPQIDKLIQQRNNLVKVYQGNHKYLARQLDAVFTDIPTLGPRDVHNRVLNELKLLCPNHERLLNAVARVLLTLAQNTTREEITDAFAKE